MLVYQRVTPITMVYGRYNELVNGVYKPTFNWGAPHCRIIIYYLNNLMWVKHGSTRPYTTHLGMVQKPPIQKVIWGMVYYCFTHIECFLVVIFLRQKCSKLAEGI